MRLPRYEAMRPAGATAFVSIPNHWEVKRLRSVATVRNSNVDKLTKRGETRVRLCNYTDVYKKSVIRSDDRFMEATATEEEMRAFHLRVGDVIITKDSEDWQDIGVPAYVASTADDLLCGYHLTMLRPRTDLLAGRFLYWLLRSNEARREFAVAARGVTRYGMTLVGMKNVSVLVPPPDEQAAIVRFLDHAVGRLDRAIAAKRRVVRLLEEQRRAVVHRAVTRGLDEGARMVDSNVPWLGEVPEGWEVVRLKRVVGPIDQGWSPQCEGIPAGEGEWGVLKVGCVNRDAFTYEQNKRLPDHLAPRPKTRIYAGDIVVSRANTSELVGLAAYVDSADRLLMLSDKHYRFQPRASVAFGPFLTAVLRSGPSRLQLEERCSGASNSMQNISKDVLANLIVALPPEPVQREIMKEAEAARCPFEENAAALDHEITLLEEYRTALVSEVVTGRRDVRAAAAALPAPPPPAADPEAFDAGEDDLEDELTEAALA